MSERSRVLVLSRSYPSDFFATLGLLVERPTEFLSESYDITVVSPVPSCPSLPEKGPAAQHARFRRVPTTERRRGAEVG